MRVRQRGVAIRLFVSTTAVAAALFAVAIGQAAAAPAPVKLKLGLTMDLLGPDAGKLGAGARVHGKVGVSTEDGSENPVISGGHVRVPHGIAFNVRRSYLKCIRSFIPEDTIETCPERSIMGSGRKTSIIDEPPTIDSVDFIDGGGRTIWGRATIFSPAIVVDGIAVRVKELRDSKWGHELSFKVPIVLQVVAGIPMVAPRNFDFEIGGKRWAHKYISFHGRCPRRGFLAIKVSLDYRFDLDGATGTVNRRDRLRCNPHRPASGVHPSPLR
jgi:uncharacterized membrane protein YhaH (DUF805 family)